MKNKRKPDQRRRQTPLNVSGVGHGTQKCEFNCTIPCAFKTADGYLAATYDTPVINDSTTPSLLGLNSMRRMRTVIDTNTFEAFLLGPGDYDLMTSLPPGTQRIQCEQAPSGHMCTPCDYFEELDKQENDGGLQVKTIALPVHTQEEPTSQ